MKSRKCSVCHRSGHDARRHQRNPQFFTAGGVVHPMRKEYPGKRSWHGPYSQAIVDYEKEGRTLYGQTSADQQLAKQFDKYIRKSQRQQKLEERLYQLEHERSGLKETLEQDTADDLRNVIAKGGQAQGKEKMITLAKAQKLTGKASQFRASAVKLGAHTYVPWNAVLDSMAEERGFADDRALLRGIERAKGQREKIQKLTDEIVEIKRQLPKAAGGTVKKSTSTKAHKARKSTAKTTRKATKAHK